MKKVWEPAAERPVIGQHDVAVVGGGVAGIAAALAARRTGASVILLEREFLLGGLATLGLVTIYLPLCDGRGRQASFGLAEELLRLSVKEGYEESWPDAWLEHADPEARKHQRFQVQFNAAAFGILAEQKLLEEGVTVRYGTQVCAVLKQADQITTLLVEEKAGRCAIEVGAVVDCSGDADVCVQAGAPTYTFQQGNLLAAWYYHLTQGRVRLKALGVCDVPERDKVRETPSLDGKRYTGLDAEEISAMVAAMHKAQWEDFLKDGGISSTHLMTTIPTIPELRMTRCLKSDCVLGDEEPFRYEPHSVGMISDWRKAGPVYEIPLECLRAANVSNLYAAGRCISVTEPMWDITRVIQGCAVTGEAAGAAAGLKGASVAELQAHLEAQGVRLHWNA